MKEKFPITETQTRLEAEAKKLGYEIERVSYAETGSVYVYLKNETTESIIRIADHASCYEREDMSIDPEGWELFQVVKVLAENANLPIPIWVKRMITVRLKKWEAEKIAREKSVSEIQARRNAFEEEQARRREASGEAGRIEADNLKKEKMNFTHSKNRSRIQKIQRRLIELGYYI